MISSTQGVILKLLSQHEPLGGLELVRKSNGLLKRSSIYVILSRLEESGLVESKYVDTPKGERGPRRRQFVLTVNGKAELAERLAHQRQLNASLGLEG